MIEKKELNLSVSKSGSGSNTFRVILPTRWIRDMGLSETERKLNVSYDEENKIITIEKGEQ